MATYDLSLQDTKGGYVAGDSVNLDLLTAWLVSGGITVTSLAVDAADPSLIHVDASAEPDLQDSWPLYWNNTLWQTGDPLPTPPAIEEDFVPNATPDTEAYTLDLADTALGYTLGDNIRVDQISQYLTDKGNPAQSVTPIVDGTGAQTGEIQVVRLASGSNISTGNWAAFDGPASVTIFGQNSVGEPPAGPVVTQSVEQGTHFGDGAVASGLKSTAYGKDAKASGVASTAVGDGTLATGNLSTAVGERASATGNFSTAVGENANASGGVSLAVGSSASANADLSLAVGDSAVVNTGSDRSFAIGAFASVPANTPDLGVILANTVEQVRSNGTGATVYKLHSPDGTAHIIGFSNGTGILTVDGVPVLTSIGTGYITSTMILDGTITLADLSAALIANFATAAALTTEMTNRTTADSTHAALTATHGVTGALVGTSDTQTLTNKTLTAPVIADFTSAAHDHSAANKGGNIPEASVTGLVADLAAKASTTALTTETTNRTNADLLLLPKKAIPSGQYYTNLNYGCYGSITTLALAANTGYFIPIDMMYGSGSFTNISLNITATGTATTIKWAVYARSASGNATGNVLASGSITPLATGFAAGLISPSLVMPTDGVPVEYNLCFVLDGTLTVTAVSGVRNMYRSGNMLLTVTSGRTAGVTYTTGFVNSPTYTYTDQQIVPLAGLKAA